MRTKSRWGKKKLLSNCKTIYPQYFVTLFHVCFGYYLDTPLAEWNSLQPVSPSWAVNDMVQAAGLCTLGPGCPLPTRWSGSVSWGGKTGLNRVYLRTFCLFTNLDAPFTITSGWDKLLFPHPLSGLAAENKACSTFSLFLHSERFGIGLCGEISFSVIP